MKILQVIDTLSVGGAENVFVTICNVLSKNDIDVSTLFILKAGALELEINNKIPSFELSRFNKWSIIKMYKCSKIISKFDIIHCHSRHNYRYIKLVSILFNIDAKLIFHEHSSNKKIPIFFNSFLRPKYIISSSTEMATVLKSKLKVIKSNIFILPNSIRKSAIDKKISYKNKFDFVLVSNFKENKKIKFVIELIQKTDASLLIIGQNSNKKYYNEIVDEIKSKKLNVEIKDTIVNVQEVLSNASIGLHSSINETGPLVLIEYLAKGLPFLAFETGEVSVIIKKYYPEFFIDNLDANKWLERINYIKTKNYDSIEMDAIFEKHFGEAVFFDKLFTIYLCITN